MPANKNKSKLILITGATGRQAERRYVICASGDSPAAFSRAIRTSRRHVTFTQEAAKP
jgi:hypothetical protein